MSLAPFALATLASGAETAIKSTRRSSSLANPPHFSPRAKSVISLFQIGGPSQLDLFDPKPALARYAGEPLPESIQRQISFAQIQEKQPRVMPSTWKFSQHGECGTAVSELMPFTARVVDHLTFLKTLRTDDTNHMFAELLFNTGWRRFGRPSLGSWVAYGLGSESEDLPAFTVLRSGMRPRSKAANYGHGFLPSKYQGTPFRDGSEPILNLASPTGFTVDRERASIDAINVLNKLRFNQTGDDEISTRIASYETAFRMQSAAPELLNIRSESAETLKLYGITHTAQSNFARNCLLARRLVERGVRFVQLFHGDWDHHQNIAQGLPKQCREVDQGSAALVLDLARRGLLDDTLVVWGGELGRTPVAQKSDKPDVAVGRDHQIEAFTIWLAGGGIRPGQVVGQTNEFGCLPVTESWHVHDLQATILHLLGLDHTRLTFRHQGRDFRLTDLDGRVIQDVVTH